MVAIAACLCRIRRTAYASIVRLITENFTIVERVQPEDSKTILLVCR